MSAKHDASKSRARQCQAREASSIHAQWERRLEKTTSLSLSLSSSAKTSVLEFFVRGGECLSMSSFAIMSQNDYCHENETLNDCVYCT